MLAMIFQVHIIDHLDRFKVIIPAIVEDILKKQALPIKEGAVKAFRPDALSLSLETELSSPLPVKLGALTLALYKKDGKNFFPFSHISFPPQQVSKNTVMKIENQVDKIENRTELVKWLNDVFDNDEVTLAVRGRPDLKLASLKYKPHLDKVITLPGLRGLEGFSLEKIDLSLPPASKGVTFKGRVMLPNWGRLTLDLGNLTFNVFLGDLNVGELLLKKVLLPPGNTTLDAEGKLELRTIISNLGQVLSSQSKALGKGQIEIGVQTKQVEYNGKRIPYIEDLLNPKRLTAPIPILTLLSSALNGFVGGLGGSGDALDSIGSVFGNKTFIQGLLDNWGTGKDAVKNAELVKRMLKHYYGV